MHVRTILARRQMQEAWYRLIGTKTYKTSLQNRYRIAHDQKNAFLYDKKQLYMRVLYYAWRLYSK